MADELTIEFGLATWIEALPEAVAVEAKCYAWGDAPQTTTTRPFVLYHRVTGRRLRTLTGPSGVSHPTIQLDVVGRNYLAVKRLAEAIRKELDDLARGTLIGGKTVQVAICNDDRDAAGGDVRPLHGDELAEHRETIEVTIWFDEG